MMNDKIKINHIKKKDKKRQLTLTFETDDSGHEPEIDPIEDKL